MERMRKIAVVVTAIAVVAVTGFVLPTRSTEPETLGRTETSPMGETSPMRFDRLRGRKNGLILFTSVRPNRGGQLYVVDVTGRERQLTAGGAAASVPIARWAPLGWRIAIDEPGRRLLDSRFKLVEVPVGHPSWAPDGRRVVGNEQDEVADVIVFDLRTHERERIFPIRDDPENYPSNQGNAWSAAWSPDGQTIAMAFSFRGMTPSVVLHYVGGRGLRVSLAYGNNPAWSPDSRQLALDKFGLDAFDTGPGDAAKPGVYVADLSGETARLLVADAYSPVWSPDGTKIAFVRGVQKSSEIFVISVDGTGLRRLTNNPWPDFAPDWQPVRR
jgi:Tol biopolymer transport system component